MSFNYQFGENGDVEKEKKWVISVDMVTGRGSLPRGTDFILIFNTYGYV